MNRMPRIVALCGAVVLLATAALHATGYTGVSRALASASIDPFWMRALPRIWLFFSWHLVALGLATVWAALRQSRQGSRALVAFAAIVAGVDTIWVFSLAGLFVGTAMLAVAVACLTFAAVAWPRPVGPA